MNHIREAISRIGGTAKLASMLGVAQNRIGNWMIRGIPVEMSASIEKASKEQIMRWDLRPNDWWKIWPELTERKDAPPIPEQAHE